MLDVCTRSDISNYSPPTPVVLTMAALTTFPAPTSDLTVLLLGNGGREHALAWKLAQSPRVAKVYVTPGNGGTALMGGKVENVAVPFGGAKGFGEVVAFAREKGVELVVPGPELPLVEGCEVEFRKGELWAGRGGRWAVGGTEEVGARWEIVVLLGARLGMRVASDMTRKL
jgi:hypothetical protein